ncbi:MAG: RNA-binding domain-containing protein, partial [Thermoplasmata archaeon]
QLEAEYLKKYHLEAATYIYPTEVPERVLCAFNNIFPGVKPSVENGKVFATIAPTDIIFLKFLIARQKIRDSVRAVLYRQRYRKKMLLRMNKQVAYVGKISVVEEERMPLGTIDLVIYNESGGDVEEANIESSSDTPTLQPVEYGLSEEDNSKDGLRLPSEFDTGLTFLKILDFIAPSTRESHSYGSGTVLQFNTTTTGGKRSGSLNKGKGLDSSVRKGKESSVVKAGKKTVSLKGHELREEIGNVEEYLNDEEFPDELFDDTDFDFDDFDEDDEEYGEESKVNSKGAEKGISSTSERKKGLLPELESDDIDDKEETYHGVDFFKKDLREKLKKEEELMRKQEDNNIENIKDEDD